ncbi:MAG TPA: ABC transporter permease [Terriglobia bacterium]|nr:ABC transporter permease [Terriglobia bacterium]
MRWIYKLPLRLRSLFRKKRVEDDLSAELRFHLDRLIEANAAKGMSVEEARYAALREFGGIEQMKEECRDSWGVRVIHEAAQDLHYGLRQLRRNPGFTVIAILTLALGIGANTAIFSVVDAVLLRPLSYPHPDQIVLMFDVPLKQSDALGGISYRDFTEIRQQNRVFSEMAGNSFHDLTLTGTGEPSIVNTADVTPEIFLLLGAKPLAGRTLLPEDGKRGAAPVALLSENLWRTRFGSDPALIGRSINLDMRSFSVVGILPASFHYPDGAVHQDVWIPIAQDPVFGPLTLKPGVPVMSGVGRLKPGASIAEAQAEMDTLSARLAKEYPAQDSGVKIRIVPFRQLVVGDVKPALLVLLAAVGLVLLIACANIANLLLSRATSRAHEIAMRTTLGAGRARIVRQLLTESALLGLLGGIAGVVLAAWGVWSFRPFLPPDVTRINSIHVGGPVLVFALLLSLAAALVFGLAPAFLAAPSNLQTAIQEGSERAGQRGGRYMRSFLSIAEISLAMVLLVAGGLLIRSFARVTSVNPGFDPENVTEAEVSLPQFEYSTPQQWTAFSRDLLARLHAQPGLRDSALGGPLPMDRQGEANFAFTIAGNPPLPPGKTSTADYATVSPEYFRVMRIPLLRGRFFSEQDSPSNPMVAIISETLARRYFPNQDPIGRQMRFGFPPNSDVSRKIVGVVGDVRDVALSREPGPMMYVPFPQAPLWGGEVVVRSSSSPSSVARHISEVVHSIDKDLPVTDVQSFPDVLGASVAQERFRTLLMASFSAIALLLATIGIFGVISYSVSQRTREIGIRMALGAEKGDVLRMVIGQGLKLALTGVAIGIAGAFVLTRFLAGLLYSVTPTDPLTFVAVSVVLIAVALAACYIPARRASKVDPMVALRHE